MINMKIESNLQNVWLKAQKDLGLTILLNHKVELNDKSFVKAEVLLKDFGAKNGMLLFCDFGYIKKYTKHLIDLGYGYSILSGNSCNYNRDDFIEMLSDWGWSGDKDNEPNWLTNI